MDACVSLLDTLQTRGVTVSLAAHAAGSPAAGGWPVQPNSLRCRFAGRLIGLRVSWQDKCQGDTNDNASARSEKAQLKSVSRLLGKAILDCTQEGPHGSGGHQRQ